MELLNSILYDTVYHSAPIILCVIGGIFAYKANVLNIALEAPKSARALYKLIYAMVLPPIVLEVTEEEDDEE